MIALSVLTPSMIVDAWEALILERKVHIFYNYLYQHLANNYKIMNCDVYIRILRLLLPLKNPISSRPAVNFYVEFCFLFKL
jgi:hypothetical protein